MLGPSSQLCMGIKSIVLATPDPGLRRMYELKYPDCFAPASVGIQALDQAINHVTMILLTTTQQLAVSVLLVFAAPLLVIVGARIALGVENGVVIPVGRAFLALALAFGGIQILPTLAGSVFNQFQTWGTGVGRGMAPYIKQDMSLNPVFTSGSTSGNIFNSIMTPMAVNLDPISILKMGGEDAAGLVTAQMFNMPPLSLTHIGNDIGVVARWFAWTSFDIFAGIGLVLVFAYLGAKMLSVLLRAHIFIALSPFLAAFHAFRGVNIGENYSKSLHIHRVITLVLRESFKLFVVYITIPIILAFQVTFINIARGG